MIQILQGGVVSGFTKVVAEAEQYPLRLFHVKGTANNVRVVQTQAARASLNAGDVFVLDSGLKIWQWNGSSASASEKMKAGQLTRAMREERNGRPTVIVLDQGDADADFWALLGGPGPILSATEGGSDQAHSVNQNAANTVPKLFRLSDSTGTLKFDLLAQSPPKFAPSLLDHNDVFILDFVSTVFVWVGKGASPAEKRSAMFHAQQYITSRKI